MANSGYTTTPRDAQSECSERFGDFLPFGSYGHTYSPFSGFRAEYEWLPQASNRRRRDQEICFEMLRALHRLTIKSKIFHLSVGAAAIGKRASASVITSCLLPLPLLQDARGSETRFRAYFPTRRAIRDMDRIASAYSAFSA